MSMTFAEGCAGISATSVASAPLGWRPLWFSEIEPFPCALLKHYHPEVPNLGNLLEIKDAPTPDVFVAGTPCQAFSLAGLREGFKDPRGNVTLGWLKLLAKLRPRWFVWENVPGVLTSWSVDAAGYGEDVEVNAFSCILAAVSQLGYGWAWRVLDAQFFGVPQLRRRVILVGHLGDGLPAQAVLFEPEGVSRNSTPRRTPGNAAPRAVPPSAVVAGGVEWVGECLTGDRTHTLCAAGFDASEDGTGRGPPLIPGRLLFGRNNGSGPVETSHCLSAKGGSGRYDFETETFVVEPGGPSSAVFSCDMSGNFRQRRATSTLNAQGQSLTSGIPITVTPNLCVRRTTPLEWERLQGFPDNYTLIPFKSRGKKAHLSQYAAYFSQLLQRPITPEEVAQLAPDGPRYRALGNSQPVPMMRWVYERLDAIDKTVYGMARRKRKP